MAELRIWTVRHTIKVAAPPKQVYQLIANVDRWPQIFDSVLAVEHIGYDRTGERVRFWGTFAERRGSWVSSREVNPKRLQVRFRRERSAHPFASLGGLWLVAPKGTGSTVALDHYYRIVDDDQIEAKRVDESIEDYSNTMLEAVRSAAELGGLDDVWLPVPERMGESVEGLTLR
ncbi:MAG TPA: aromatase/cyclase [Actinophytocola sp.]|nr:aromatase/cyclase [Actinophytocola sp.]